MNDAYEIKYSPLGARIERDGRAIQVEIYRGTGSPDELWILEVVDEDTRDSILWDEKFGTDAEAMAFLQQEIEAHGLDGVIDAAPEAVIPQ